MSGSGAGGHSKSSSNSETRQLTAAERAAIYNGGLNSINASIAQQNTPTYQAPVYSSMNNGDYDRMEQNMYDTRTAGIDRAKTLDSQRVDADLAKRGIWSSGLAAAAQGDNNERYATSYLQAGGDAATQRYGMQQQDLNAKNTFDAQQAAASYQAAWQPLNYYADLWNKTSGQNSSSSSKSFAINAGGSAGFGGSGSGSGGGGEG